jgi:putative glycosyltransferase (TIGR04348 family)
MKIALVTPARPHARSGNRHTALRWAAFLRDGGHRVAVSTQWDGKEAALMLALHARRSHASIRAFHERYPESPLVLALTGTDVYRDIHASRDARASLEMATRFVVLQPKAIEELPRRLRGRCCVVIQSSSTQLRHRPVKRGFRVCVLGHLREEKDPFRTLEALALVPARAGIHVVQAGDSLDDSLSRQATHAMRTETRYRWLGGIPHAGALRLLASSHAMVISSRMEGGANVVSEAIRVGVPVIASRIPGNVGLLGDDYPGYFRTGSARELAAVLRRAAADRRFYDSLKARIRRLRPLVAPANEARLLLAAVGKAIREF